MPKFTHDCEACTFLGPYQGYDLYVCDTSVIARFGNDGPEYSSLPISVVETTTGRRHHVNRPLIEALRRSKDL